MNRWASAIVLVLASMLAITDPGNSAAAPSFQVAAQSSQAGDFSARRAHRRRHDDERTYRPPYLGRPTYYAPAPFFPLPPFFGYGWEPW